MAALMGTVFKGQHLKWHESRLPCCWLMPMCPLSIRSRKMIGPALPRRGSHCQSILSLYGIMQLWLQDFLQCHVWRQARAEPQTACTTIRFRSITKVLAKRTLKFCRILKHANVMLVAAACGRTYTRCISRACCCTAVLRLNVW